MTRLNLKEGNTAMNKNTLLGLLGTLAALTIVPVAASAPAFAVDNIESADAPDLTGVKTKISAKDYTGALKELRGIAEDTQQADVYNLLGFTLRKTGDYKNTLNYITKALEFSPPHHAP